jgi:hypothetical protein
MADSFERKGRTRQDGNPNLVPTDKASLTSGRVHSINATPQELFPPSKRRLKKGRDDFALRVG